MTNEREIVERLRACGPLIIGDLLPEAASLIERLVSERDAARAEVESVNLAHHQTSVMLGAKLRELAGAKTELTKAIAEASEYKDLLRTPIGFVSDKACARAYARGRAEGLEQAAAIARTRGEEYREPTQAHYDFRQGCFDAAEAIQRAATRQAKERPKTLIDEMVAKGPLPDEVGDIRAGKLAGHWQPIETAPKDGTDVFLFFPLEGLDHEVFATRVIASHRGGHWVFQGRAVRGYSDALQPTHWMPLPSPPNGGK